MKHIRNLALATALVLVAANSRSPAAGTVVGLYEFGTGSTGSYASTDADADSTASVISLGSGLSATSDISTSGGNPAPQLYLKPVNSSSETTAITNTKYIQFTITPSSGTLSFDSLSFDYTRDNETTAKFYGLYSSIGGFTAGSSIDTNSTAFSSVSPTFTNYSVVLSGIPSLQVVSAPVTFRLYFWGGTTTTSNFRLDNITLTTAAIPEPATYALVASGGLFLLVLCRRQRRSASLLAGA